MNGGFKSSTKNKFPEENCPEHYRYHHYGEHEFCDSVRADAETRVFSFRDPFDMSSIESEVKQNRE